MAQDKSQMELMDMSFISTSNNDYIAVGDVNTYKVDICRRKDISGFIGHWHYSKKVNGINSDYNFKLTDSKGNLIGAMMYGRMAMADVWKKYAKEKTDLVELRRLCCIDNTPKNTESYFIGKTLKWLKQNTDFKIVISYADTTYNHEGTIYKASNFKHRGLTANGRVIMHEGKRYHDKSVRTMYKGRLRPFAKKLKIALEKGEAYYVETKPKHIYTYELRRIKSKI